MHIFDTTFVGKELTNYFATGARGGQRGVERTVDASLSAIHMSSEASHPRADLERKLARGADTTGAPRALR